ncbi:MAG: hypothetical protein KDI31_12190, partial [Pseudomonadales bacterium]|nr:hypothetical protein [Pseudomonadales bacterium]
MPVGYLKNSRIMQTIRSRVAFHIRQHGFDHCMQRIVDGQERPIPGSLIAEAFAQWGDPLSASDEGYLRSCLAEVSATSGAILQCGAGLSTLVLGAICHGSNTKGHQLWCLEHDRHWASTIRSWLTEYRVANTHVIHSRAQMFEGYTWYSVDTARLAKTYSLVLCEGVRASPRGAFGALRRLEGHLASSFVMLARDAGQAADLKLLKSWADANEAKFVLVDRQEGFVKISRQ